MNQLERLNNNREFVIKLITDETVSRSEALKILGCSTRALYKFMENEKISWVRKPHDGSNQFTKNPIKRISQERLETKFSHKNLIFDSPTENLEKRGVYRIVSATGGLYIGIASWSFRKRFREHKRMLNNGSHHCVALQRSFAKNSSSTFEPIEFFSEDTELLIEREQYWWDYYNDKNYKIYNGRPTITGDSLFHTEETKRKISLSKQKAFNDTEKEEILKLRKTGASKLKIRKTLQVSQNRLDRFLREEGYL